MLPISYYQAFRLLSTRLKDLTHVEFHKWILTGDIKAYFKESKQYPVNRGLQGLEENFHPTTYFFDENEIADFPDDQFTGRYFTFERLTHRWTSTFNIDINEAESIIRDHFNRDKAGGIITDSMVLGNRGYLGLTCRGLFQTLAENYKGGLYREEEVKVFEEWMFGDVPVIQSEATPKKTIETTLAHDTSEWSEYFDPLPISGIALLFPIKGEDEEGNLLTWKKRADQASKNGLKICRAIKKESGKYKFNPWLVGEWLVNKGDITREHAQRKLANNLPEKNSHVKEFILQ